MFDFNKPDDGAIDMAINHDPNLFDLANFNPHGVGIWDDTPKGGKMKRKDIEIEDIKGFY